MQTPSAVAELKSGVSRQADTSVRHGGVWRFDAFELRAHERLLFQQGQPVKIGGRAFDLLVALIERRNRVVPKFELLDLVWPQLVVVENNLQVHVLALRKLLGPQAITTVPGRGYRFTAPIEPIPEVADAAVGLLLSGPHRPSVCHTSARTNVLPIFPDRTSLSPIPPFELIAHSVAARCLYHFKR